ncbi:helix-turn-helix domain-containing protein [Taibaiella chishuiensis]|uniref:AraC family transcriptional regulator n=1 Tax=Taibaiella chishuiensis TaxID=1434707 RepID=A0A2P8CX01_9BACT|nr:AraC family transcriptional regulator [Taibaiella chishuiensis]PSK89505.1 AraC family transcriptional regulator [Taibaiella chishuiensis]
MKDLNCGKIIKESPQVLSWNQDVFLMSYLRYEDVFRANMCVHMNHIGIVLQGQKEILGKDSKTVVPAGAGFFMKKGAYLVTDTITDPGKGYEAIVIFFSDEWLSGQFEAISACSKYVSPEQGGQPPGDSTLLAKDELMHVLALQLKTWLCVNTTPERLRDLLPKKVLELFQVLISAPGGQYFERQLRSMDRHVNPGLVQLKERYYQEHISLEQYAFLANCSLSTFKRKFTQTFKTNPGKWIMQRRLEAAYELLVSSDKNVTEIAYETGFETPAHFIASFKQKYHLTPKQLQQRV